MRTNKPLITTIINVISSIFEPKIRKAISVDFVKVLSVDAQKMTATVESYEDKGQYKVPLALDSDLKTAWIKPKDGSDGYVIDCNGVKFFSHFSKVEKITIGDGSTEQGTIKIKEQQDEINKLKDTVNELISKFNALQNDYKNHTHGYTTGTPPVAAITTTLTAPFLGQNQTDAQPINKDNYELIDIIKVKY